MTQDRHNARLPQLATYGTLPEGDFGGGMSMSAGAALGAPFRVGAALSRALDVFRAGFFKFIVLTALPMAPVLVLEIAGAQLPASEQGGLSGLSTILQYVLGALATGTCLYGAYQIMRGKPFTVGESFSAAGGRLGGLIGAEFVSAIITGIGMIFFVVPGIMAACALYVALPVVMVEKLGTFASLRRSRALTYGFRWSILGLLALFLALSLVTVAVVGAIIAALIAAAGEGAGGMAAIIVGFLALVVVEAFAAVLSAVVYHDLRAAKEGVDIEQLANVFA